VDTIWADEQQKTRAFMRMSITEADSDCDMNMNMNMNMNAAMPDMGAASDTAKTVEQKAKDTLDCMMKKAKTTVEQAKQAAESIDLSNIGG
jgi:hypothetical protein